MAVAAKSSRGLPLKPGQLFPKPEVDINLLIRRTIERPRLRLRRPATRLRVITKQHQLRMPILLTLLRKNLRPLLLHVVKHRRNQMSIAVFACGRGNVAAKPTASAGSAVEPPPPGKEPTQGSYAPVMGWMTSSNKRTPTIPKPPPPPNPKPPPPPESSLRSSTSLLMLPGVHSISNLLPCICWSNTTMPLAGFEDRQFRVPSGSPPAVLLSSHQWKSSPHISPEICPAS